jgi:hypothetical protein
LPETKKWKLSQNTSRLSTLLSFFRAEFLFYKKRLLSEKYAKISPEKRHLSEKKYDVLENFAAQK